METEVGGGASAGKGGARRIETAFEALRDAARNGLDWSQHRELGKAVIDGAAELGKTVGIEMETAIGTGAGPELG